MGEVIRNLYNTIIPKLIVKLIVYGAIYSFDVHLLKANLLICIEFI